MLIKLQTTFSSEVWWGRHAVVSPNSRQREREREIVYPFFLLKRNGTQNPSKNFYFGKRVFFDIPMSLRMINCSTHSTYEVWGYKKEITIPKVPLTFQAWYHENGWFWFGNVAVSHAGNSTRDIFFSANQLNKSPLENPRFCDTSRMEFDRWSACYALVEMSELCDDQIGLLCESKSLRLQIMEMMGDDPNSIDVWWAGEKMNDDQHPAISSYWLTWSFTKPLADSARCYVSFADFGSIKVDMWHYK